MMAVDRKAELDAIEHHVRMMREAAKRASDVELRYRSIEIERRTRPDRRKIKTEAPREEPREPAERAPAFTPPAVERARFFSKVSRWATADWYELLLPPTPRIFVPDGCLFTGGDRAWRRETVW